MLFSIVSIPCSTPNRIDQIRERRSSKYGPRSERKQISTAIETPVLLSSPISGPKLSQNASNFTLNIHNNLTIFSRERTNDLIWDGEFHNCSNYNCKNGSINSQICIICQNFFPLPVLGPQHLHQLLPSTRRWHSFISWWVMGVPRIRPYLVGVPFVFNSCDAYITNWGMYELLHLVNSYIKKNYIRPAKSAFKNGYLQQLRMDLPRLYISKLHKSTRSIRSICVPVIKRTQQHSQSELLLQRLLNAIPNPVNIYIGGSDMPLPAPVKLTFLTHRNVNKLFTDNMDSVHEKLIPIPIGLSGNSLGDRSMFETYVIKSLLRPWRGRKNAIYFGGFYPSQRGGRDKAVAYARKHCSICACPSRRISVNNSVTVEAYYEELLKYKYAFSPFGEGWDCHRTSEILALGVVPVLPCWPGALAYRHLPVVVLGSLTELTRANLSSWNAAFESIMRSDNLNQSIYHGLSPAYWADRLEDLSPPAPPYSNVTLLRRYRRSQAQELIPHANLQTYFRATANEWTGEYCSRHKKFLSQPIPTGPSPLW